MFYLHKIKDIILLSHLKKLSQRNTDLVCKIMAVLITLALDFIQFALFLLDFRVFALWHKCNE